MKHTRTPTLLLLLMGTGCVTLQSDPLTPLASHDPLFAPSQMAAGGRFMVDLPDPRRKAPVNEPGELMADGHRTTPRSWGARSKQYQEGPIRVSDRYAERQRLADAALSLVGAERIVVGGQKFPNDCSGFVRAVYASRGIDVYRTPRLARADNGVRIIHKFSGDREGLHRRVFPRIGDLVFFDRTWDRNGNGRDGDDRLTHVGIVEHVDDDGAVVTGVDQILVEAVLEHGFDLEVWNVGMISNAKAFILREDISYRSDHEIRFNSLSELKNRLSENRHAFIICLIPYILR